jgi:transcriptional regulator with XRE-family HTH domain
MPETRNGDRPTRKKVIARNNLQKLRERHKRDGGFYLTLAEMATLMGIAESQVSRHESGQRGLSTEDANRYARILKVDPLEIFPHLTHSD